MIPILVCVIGVGLSPNLAGIARPHMLTGRDEARLVTAVDSVGADDWNDPDVRPARSRICQAVFGQGAELSWIESRPSPSLGGAL